MVSLTINCSDRTVSVARPENAPDSTYVMELESRSLYLGLGLIIYFVMKKYVYAKRIMISFELNNVRYLKLSQTD